MNLQNVKGGYDYLPKEQIIRNYINDVLKNTFEKYGYQPIETPILCYYDILSDKYDEKSELLNEIYKLSDQGNRKLGLRYDLTVPFAKLIALNKNIISMPFKRYEIAKVFRDGPVKLGRDREFIQCDVDVVGINGQEIEAELLSLYVEAFKKLGIKIIIKYNNRKLTTGILKYLGIDEKLIPEVTSYLDKLEKISRNELLDSLMSINISKEQCESIFKYFSYSLDALNKELKNSEEELILSGFYELNRLKSYLDYLEISEYCSFTPSLVRGQNYYTGNVFEVYDADSYITCSIGGGGRYDKMIKDFINDGCEYPSVGISFGLSAIYEILKEKKTLEKDGNKDIYIIPISTFKESLKLANKLRTLGYKVDLEFTERKLKKSLAYVNKERIPYVIILGDEEIKNGIFKIKDMFKGEEYEFRLDAIEEIKKVVFYSK